MIPQEMQPQRRRGIAEAQRREQEEKVLRDISEAIKSVQEVRVPKGMCPHCLTHIGRGIYFHVQRCTNNEQGNG